MASTHQQTIQALCCLASTCTGTLFIQASPDEEHPPIPFGTVSMPIAQSFQGMCRRHSGTEETVVRVLKSTYQFDAYGDTAPDIISDVAQYLRMHGAQEAILEPAGVSVIRADEMHVSRDRITGCDTVTRATLRVDVYETREGSKPLDCIDISTISAGHCPSTDDIFTTTVDKANC